MTSLPVLIPVNVLSAAKGRLAGLLTAEERATLALITLETVLRASGSGAVVLTRDSQVAKRAEGRARLLPESPDAAGLNGQLEHAVQTLLHDGTASDGMLILHADLPLASHDAIDTLASTAVPGSVVMVESRDGGTNAMLLSRPGAFPLAYGKASFEAHERAANTAGLNVIRNTNRELRLDLDTPDDIRELLRAPRGRQGASGVFLLSIGIEERLERLR